MKKPPPIARAAIPLEIIAWLSVFVAIAGLCRRVTALEKQVSDLKNKPCLMSGAHTGCKRIEQ